MKPPKIIMIAGHYYPEVGGAENQLRKLCGCLLRSDSPYDLEVLTLHQRGLIKKDTVDGVSVTRCGIVGFGRLKSMSLSYQLVKRLLVGRKSGVIIHVHGASYLSSLCCLLAYVFQKPVIVKISNSGERFDFNRISRYESIKRMHLFCHKKGNVVFIALTVGIRKQLLRSGFQKNRLIIIPNGVEIPIKLAGSKNMDSDVIKLLFVGRLEPQKNPLFILEVVSRLNIKYHLTIVGDGQLFRHIDKQIEQKYLETKVTLVGGVDPKKVTEYLSQKDVLLIPSFTEGMSNVMLEGMSYKMVILASDITANKAVFINQDDLLQACILELKVERWVEAITLLAKSSSLRSKLKNKTKILAAKYDMRKIAKQYESLYGQLLNDL